VVVPSANRVYNGRDSGVKAGLGGEEVFGDLGAQVGEGGELAFVPQFCDEGELEFLAVQVALEAEEMRFDPQLNGSSKWISNRASTPREPMVRSFWGRE